MIFSSARNIMMWSTMAARRGLSAPSLGARCLVSTRPRILRPVLLSLPARARFESTVRGEEQSGHIRAGPNEAILFFDNIFPLKLINFVRWPFYPSDRDLTDLLKRFQSSSLGAMDPINLVKQAIPDSLPIEVTEIVPRLKDGGAFVKFRHADDTSPTEIESSLRRLLARNPRRPWFNPFRGIQAGLVRGVPWLEDLYRFPQGRLRVEFVSASDDAAAAGTAAELSQETLYGLFRRYGKLAEISSQPAESKVAPRFAHVDFVLVRDAIMARNCMHGFVVREGGGSNGNGNSIATRLRLSYERRARAHRFWDWMAAHPRIVIPVVAALLAAVTVAVFDPIREFCIKMHVQNSFGFGSGSGIFGLGFIANTWLYKWFVRQTSDMLAFRKRRHGGGSESDAAGLGTLFTHRKELIDSIDSWLLETTDTFIVVQGPKGSGKKELVLDQALGAGRRRGGDAPDVLVLDLKPVVEARGEASIIGKLAAQVGYRPVFSWANQLSGLVDLAIQGTTGVKAGFSETLEAQVVKILQTTAAALKQVSLARRKKDREAGQQDANLSEDAYLEAHPERRAVVVVNNFLHRGDEKAMLHDRVADWAANLVQSNVAHVIFLTSDSAYAKSLSRALPDRVFHQLALGDLSPDVAKKFVLSHLEADDAGIIRDAEKGEKQQAQEQEKTQAQGQPSDPSKSSSSRRPDLLAQELDECIDALGGRLTDLQVLARRLKIGQSPSRAVSEIVEQSTAEILRMFLLPNRGGVSQADRKWSTEQAWYLIREIATRAAAEQQSSSSSSGLRYNEVLLSDTFASSTTPSASDGAAALESLAAAELITVRSSEHGRPTTIRPGRPVYYAAFARLLQDAGLRARMDLAVLGELAKVQARQIDKCEKELALIGALPGPPAFELRERAAYLLARLRVSQAKIEAFEKEMGVLKKVLAEKA